MENTNLENRIIINAASGFLSYDTEKEVLEAYDKLVELQDNNKGHEPVIDYILVWQPFEHVDVDCLLDAINSAIEVETEKIPKFIKNMDWEGLKGQKEVLQGIIEYNGLGSIINGYLEGIVSLIDGIQDYTVNELGLSENEVFNTEE